MILRNLKRLHTSSKYTFLAQKLTDRSLIRISGNDAIPFLQGLITNDMKHLTEGAVSMYAMFLNSKGRMLYDTIIYNTATSNTFFLECDSLILPSLKKHLMMYKVRRKIDVTSLENDFNVWAISDKNLADVDISNMKLESPSESVPTIKNDVIVCRDPRVSILGLRAIAPKDIDVVDEVKKRDASKQFDIIEKNFYKSLRYKLGVAEGTDELPPEKCFPLEANCDYMHGVSFHKGCYLGQEVTARTHHTGVVRKRYMPVFFKENVEITEKDVPISPNDSEKQIGKLRGAEKNVGIALLRIEEALKSPQLKMNNTLLKTVKPLWWPTEAPKERPKN